FFFFLILKNVIFTKAYWLDSYA
ncbi:hypothetical protein TIFTF001_030685, partial [Ficus carica]